MAPCSPTALAQVPRHLGNHLLSARSAAILPSSTRSSSPWDRPSAAREVPFRTGAALLSAAEGTAVRRPCLPVTVTDCVSDGVADIGTDGATWRAITAPLLNGSRVKPNENNSPSTASDKPKKTTPTGDWRQTVSGAGDCEVPAVAVVASFEAENWKLVSQVMYLCHLSLSLIQRGAFWCKYDVGGFSVYFSHYLRIFIHWTSCLSKARRKQIKNDQLQCIFFSNVVSQCGNDVRLTLNRRRSESI